MTLFVTTLPHNQKMEAQAYYQQFERNVRIILDALAAGLDLRTTALETSLPIEVYVLCEVLNQGDRKSVV